MLGAPEALAVGQIKSLKYRSKMSRRYYIIIILMFINILIAGCNASQLPKPSQTILPIKSSIPTLVFTNTPTSESTLDTTNQDYCPGGINDKYSISPNSLWKAGICINDGFTLVQEKSGAAEIKIEKEGYTYVPYKWSTDGRWLYLLVIGCPVAQFNDEKCFLPKNGLPVLTPYSKVRGFPGIEGVLQLELKSGNINDLLRNNKSYAISFSSDFKYLAYIDQTQRQPLIVIHNLVDGNDNVIRLNNSVAYAGHLKWSPDNSKLIYSFLNNNIQDWSYESNEPPKYCNINYVNLKTLEIYKIGYYENTFFKPLGWKDNNNLIMMDEINITFWFMNINTFELIQTTYEVIQDRIDHEY
jgi:hypothetical protein